MAKGCALETSKIMVLVVKILLNFFLWAATCFCIYFMSKFEKFRKRAANIIVTNLLIADSLNSLVSQTYREYLFNCTQILFAECSLLVILTRTFSYVSMAFLMFFTVERYFKIMKKPVEYDVLMSKRRLVYAIIGIWVALPIFSIITTPYWMVFRLPSTATLYESKCLYSTVMEPLTGLITITISQIFSLIFLIAINAIFGYKIRLIIMQSGQRLKISEEQRERNTKLIRRVEMNIFLNAFLLTIFNLLILGLTVVDIVEFFAQLELFKVHIPQKVVDVFVFFSTIYPILEAITCFLLNKDMLDLFMVTFTKKLKSLHMTTTKSPGALST